MTIVSRWLAPAVLAAGLGFGALMPAPAQAQDDLARVIVDVADVIFRGGHPYYRHDHRYGYSDRLIVVHDRYRRPVYYRYAPRTVYPRTVYYRDDRYRHRPPYGVANGYWRDGRYWDGHRWHDRNVRYDRRGWESRNDWRDRGHKYKYKHGRDKDRGRDRYDD